jgi:hypothetical protein
MKKWIVGGVIAIALLLPVVAPAHQGHVHKVLGTVASVQGNRVDVKGTDGKVITVLLNAKTAITRGKAKADLAALKVGERVSVDYLQEKNANTAKTVKLAELPPAAAKP